MARSHDHVLVDCPAGIETGFYNALAGAHGAVIVTVPEVSAVRDAQRVTILLKEQNLPAKLLINRFRSAMVRRGDMMDMDEVVDILKLPVLGIVPEDSRVVRHNNFGIPVVDGKGKAAESYYRIARRINGENIPIVNPAQSQGPRAALECARGVKQGGEMNTPILLQMKKAHILKRRSRKPKENALSWRNFDFLLVITVIALVGFRVGYDCQRHGRRNTGKGWQPVFADGRYRLDLHPAAGNMVCPGVCTVRDCDGSRLQNIF